MLKFRRRADRPSPSPRSCGEVYLLFWVCLELLVLVGLVSQTIHFSIGLIITYVVGTLALALLFVRLRKIPLKAALQLHPVSGRLAAVSVLLGISSWAPAIWITLLTYPALQGIIGSPPEVPWLKDVANFSALQIATLFLAASVIPGICEELMFRGAIMGSLQRQGRARAVLIRALLFMLVHVNLWNAVGPFLLGIGLGWVVIRTNSIFPAMLWHVSINAVAVTSWVAGGSGYEPAPVLVASSAAAFAALLGVFAYLTRHTPYQPSPLAAPATINRDMKLLLRGSALGATAIIAGGLIFFAVVPVATNQLAPEMESGDVVIVRRNHWGMSGLAAGDAIVYVDKGNKYLRRISRLDPPAVTVSTKLDDGTLAEATIPVQSITGKVVKVMKVKSRL